MDLAVKRKWNKNPEVLFPPQNTLSWDMCVCVCMLKQKEGLHPDLKIIEKYAIWKETVKWLSSEILCPEHPSISILSLPL